MSGCSQNDCFQELGKKFKLIDMGDVYDNLTIFQKYFKKKGQDPLGELSYKAIDISLSKIIKKNKKLDVNNALSYVKKLLYKSSSKGKKDKPNNEMYYLKEMLDSLLTILPRENYKHILEGLKKESNYFCGLSKIFDELKKKCVNESQETKPEKAIKTVDKEKNTNKHMQFYYFPPPENCGLTEIILNPLIFFFFNILGLDLDLEMPTPTPTPKLKKITFINLDGFRSPFIQDIFKMREEENMDDIQYISLIRHGDSVTEKYLSSKNSNPLITEYDILGKDFAKIKKEVLDTLITENVEKEGIENRIKNDIEKGLTDEDFDIIFEEIIFPKITQFQPEHIILSTTLSFFNTKQETSSSTVEMTPKFFKEILKKLKSIAKSGMTVFFRPFTESNIKKAIKKSEKLFEALRKSGEDLGRDIDALTKNIVESCVFPKQKTNKAEGSSTKSSSLPFKERNYLTKMFYKTISVLLSSDSHKFTPYNRKFNEPGRRNFYHLLHLGNFLKIEYENCITISNQTNETQGKKRAIDSTSSVSRNQGDTFIENVYSQIIFAITEENQKLTKQNLTNKLPESKFKLDHILNRRSKSIHSRKINLLNMYPDVSEEKLNSVEVALVLKQGESTCNFFYNSTNIIYIWYECSKKTSVWTAKVLVFNRLFDGKLSNYFGSIEFNKTSLPKVIEMVDIGYFEINGELTDFIICRDTTNNAYGKDIYIFGGKVTKVNEKDVFNKDLFKFSKNLITKVNSIIIPESFQRTGGAATLIGDKIFIIGGQDKNLKNISGIDVLCLRDKGEFKPIPKEKLKLIYDEHDENFSDNISKVTLVSEKNPICFGLKDGRSDYYYILLANIVNGEGLNVYQERFSFMRITQNLDSCEMSVHYLEKGFIIGSVKAENSCSNFNIFYEKTGIKLKLLNSIFEKKTVPQGTEIQSNKEDPSKNENIEEIKNVRAWNKLKGSIYAFIEQHLDIDLFFFPPDKLKSFADYYFNVDSKPEKLKSQTFEIKRQPIYMDEGPTYSSEKNLFEKYTGMYLQQKSTKFWFSASDNDIIKLVELKLKPIEAMKQILGKSYSTKWVNVHNTIVTRDGFLISAYNDLFETNGLIIIFSFPIKGLMNLNKDTENLMISNKRTVGFDVDRDIDGKVIKFVRGRTLIELEDYYYLIGGVDIKANPDQIQKEIKAIKIEKGNAQIKKEYCSECFTTISCYYPSVHYIKDFLLIINRDFYRIDETKNDLEFVAQLKYEKIGDESFSQGNEFTVQFCVENLNHIKLKKAEILGFTFTQSKSNQNLFEVTFLFQSTTIQNLYHNNYKKYSFQLESGTSKNEVRAEETYAKDSDVVQTLGEGANAVRNFGCESLKNASLPIISLKNSKPNN